MQTILKKGGAIIFENCQVANTFLTRLIGLMGKSIVQENQAVVFPKCNSIHTFFMRIPIDVIFVSKTGKVVRVVPELKPWKLLMPIKGAAHSIEVASQGALRKNIKIGDQLTCPGVFE